MVSVLDSRSSGPGSSPGLGHCVVFLGKTLYLPCIRFKDLFLRRFSGGLIFCEYVVFYRRTNVFSFFCASVGLQRNDRTIRPDSGLRQKSWAFYQTETYTF